MDIADFQGNETLEEDGVWIQFEDAEFLIAAHQNRAHRKAIERHRKHGGAGLRKRDPKAVEELTIQAAADALVLNWRGNVQSGGKPLPYSRENAVTLLRVRAMREWVLEQSLDVSNFSQEEEASSTEALKRGATVADGVGQQPGVPAES